MKEDNNIPEKGIEEGNRLIAEFMGGILHPEWTSTIYKQPTPTIVYTKETAPTPNSCYNWSVNGLQYHSSWDWLMPVWEKCKEIGLWMMTNGHDKLWLEKSKEIDTAIAHEIDCQKAALKISQLIKWYHSQQKIKS